MNRPDELSEALELLVDEVEQRPDGWAKLLREAEAEAPPAASRLRSRPAWRLPYRLLHGRGALRLAAAGAVAATALFAAISLVPSSTSEGCSGGVLECAAAAIGGSGPIVHVTMVHAQGDVDPYIHDVWYDTETGFSYDTFRDKRSGAVVSEGWTTPDDVSIFRYKGKLRRLELKEGDSPYALVDPSVRYFGTFPDQLRNGTAELAGKATFRGRDVYLIDFPRDEPVNPVTGKRDRVMTRVVVDAETYEPLGTGFALRGGNPLPFAPRVEDLPRVIREVKGPADVSFLITFASFEQREPGMFDVPDE
jgi:hypothetical protein